MDWNITETNRLHRDIDGNGYIGYRGTLEVYKEQRPQRSSTTYDRAMTSANL
jgi:hypothetical protein